MVTTERAKHFYSPQDIPVTLYSDADEWEVSAGAPGVSSMCFYHQDRSVLLQPWSWWLEQTGQAQVSGQGPWGRGNEENICLAFGLQEAYSLLPPQAELSFGPVPEVECPCTYLG